MAYLKKGGRWTKTVKPTPKEVDSWGHYFYDASRNSVSRDLLVSPPNALRWFGGPTGRHPIGGPRTSDYSLEGLESKKCNPGFEPKPMDGNVTYRATFQPVTSGAYELKLDGRRLGDVVAGTVSVKTPDRKAHDCHFLGGVQ